MISQPHTERLDATPTSIDRAGAIARAATIVRAGGLVAFPTETVYGLGADARNPAAIAAVFEAKGRPSDNPLIVHLADVEELATCGRLDDRARLLARTFMPGPLTLVLPALAAIPLNARAGLGTVALRVPDHEVARELLRLAGPMVGPSANRSGRPSPTTARHVLEDLDGRIDALLDAGPCRVGIESTVVDLSGARGRILRPGVISRSEIAEVLGAPVDADLPMEDGPVRSPGMKYRHYAPNARVWLVIDEVPPNLGAMRERVRVLTTAGYLDRFRGIEAHELTAEGLYASFREADADGVHVLVVYAPPGELSPALLDRVRKASEPAGSRES